MRLFCLAFHAPYRCQHSGACCTSGWPIPVEPPLADRLNDAVSAGRLRLPRAIADPIRAADGMPPGFAGVLDRDESGACSCYEKDRRRCALHRQLGEEHLPASCRHFPRVCLIDEGAAFVTLSHYCPTVSSLLFRDDLPLAIVEAPPALAREPLEGLDARGAFPPLLRPGLLADRETYREWERFVIGALAAAGSAEEALEVIADATERVRLWRPASGIPLREAWARVMAEPAAARGAVPPALRPEDLALDRLVRGAVPSDLLPPGVPAGIVGTFDRLVAPEWGRFAAPLRRYLAAKTLGNWCSYQGRGLRTVVRCLAASLAVVRVEAARHCAAAGRRLDTGLIEQAFRSADLLLVHLASREELSARLGTVEDEA